MSSSDPPGPTRPIAPRRRSATGAPAEARGMPAGYVPWWVLLALVGACGLVFFVAWAFVLASRANNPPRSSPTAVIVLVLPTAGQAATEAGGLEQTPVPEATPTIPPAPAGIIALGNYVKVVGTGGDGLRLRVGPGLQEPPNYLALESEVLVVQNGPTIADGFTWWFLVDPADDTRNGWAAENYLEVVNEP